MTLGTGSLLKGVLNNILPLKIHKNLFQIGNQHQQIQGAGAPHNFTTPTGLTSYGTQSASQFGAQMYGYGTSFNTEGQTQQFYVNQHQEGASKKRKRDDFDGDEMGEVKFLTRHIYAYHNSGHQNNGDQV